MFRPLLLCLSVLISSCVGRGLPSAPTQPGDDTSFTPPVEIIQPGLSSDPPQPLLVLPGDTVQLTTDSAKTNTYEGLIVDALGNLHVPLAGDVQVGGLSLGAAEKQVERALRRYDRFVRANIILTNPAGHTASVLGAVMEPGRVVVLPGMRLADLFAEVGGAAVVDAERERTVLADLDGARLVRAGRTVPVSLPLAIKADSRHNIRVRAGDQLYVPPGNQRLILVLGEVEAPQAISFRRGIRLTEALARAGGINIEGDRNDVRIVRGALRKPRVYHASIANLVNGKATDVELVPGDIVYVTEHWTASTGQVLNRLAPLLSIGQTAAFLGVNEALRSR